MINIKKSGLSGMAFVMTMLISCGTPTVTPSVIILSPTTDSPLTVGQSTKIVAKVVGAGLKQVDVLVDTEKFASVDKTNTPNEYNISVDWTPDLAGQHVIQVRGINASSDSAQAPSTSVIVNAKSAAPTRAPPPTAAPQPTAAPPPTAAPQPTMVQATAVPAQITIQNEYGFARVRSSPSTTSNELGQLKQNDKANVKGKNDDGKWWMIDYQGKDGWVLGELVKFTGDAAKVEVKKTADTAPTAAPVADSTSAPAATSSGAAATAKSVSTPVKISSLPTAPPVGGAAAAGMTNASAKNPVAGNPVLAKLATVPPQVTATFTPPPPPPTATYAPPPPTAIPAPTTAPYAALPYSQNMRFGPRDDIGDVPLGLNEPKSSNLLWQINGATRAELEIIATSGPGIFDQCPSGDLGSVSLQSAVGKRMPLSLPSGQQAFSINNKGYYLFTIYVTKADGSTTAIPRNVIVDCYKR